MGKEVCEMIGDWPAATTRSAYIAGTTTGSDDGSSAWRHYEPKFGVPKERFGEWMDIDECKPEKQEADMNEYLYEVYFVDAKTGTVYGRSELAVGRSEAEAVAEVDPPGDWKELPKTRKRIVFNKVGAFEKYKGEDE